MTQSNKGQFVQYPLHLIYERKDLNRDDKWVLIAMMGSCWSEGWHRLSYREISALSEVPITLLTSYKDKTGRQHEGILDRLARLGDISIDRCKEVNPMTGKPKGQPQTYIRINYQSLWQQNIEYCTKKPATSEPYKVNEGEYQSVSNTNTSVSYANTLVSNANAGVSNTNESVCVSPSEVTTYITDNIDTTDSCEDANAPHPNTLFETNSQEKSSVQLPIADDTSHTPVAVVTTRNTAPLFGNKIPAPSEKDTAKHNGHKPPKPKKPEPTPEEVAFKERCSRLQTKINEWRGYELTAKGAIINERKAIKTLAEKYSDEQIEKVRIYLFNKHWRWSKPDNRYTIGAQIILDEASNVLQILKGTTHPSTSSNNSPSPSSDKPATIDRKWLHEHPV